MAALHTMVYFCTHSDAAGNVDIVNPNWTMQGPYGGKVLWASIGRWDYMSNQCWIQELGVWYHPRCSY